MKPLHSAQGPGAVEKTTRDRHRADLVVRTCRPRVWLAYRLPVSPWRRSPVPAGRRKRSPARRRDRDPRALRLVRRRPLGVVIDHCDHRRVRGELRSARNVELAEHTADVIAQLGDSGRAWPRSPGCPAPRKSAPRRPFRAPSNSPARQRLLMLVDRRSHSAARSYATTRRSRSPEPFASPRSQRTPSFGMMPAGQPSSAPSMPVSVSAEVIVTTLAVGAASRICRHPLKPPPSGTVRLSRTTCGLSAASPAIESSDGGEFPDDLEVVLVLKHRLHPDAQIGALDRRSSPVSCPSPPMPDRWCSAASMPPVRGAAAKSPPAGTRERPHGGSAPLEPTQMRRQIQSTAVAGAGRQLNGPPGSRLRSRRSSR